MDTAFGFGKAVDMDFDAAIDKVTGELQKEGFGVLSDIDVAAKMKEKLDKDMPRYRILGACNPGLAYQAISAVEEIGLLLPCNVLVREDAQIEAGARFRRTVGAPPEARPNIASRPGVRSYGGINWHCRSASRGATRYHVAARHLTRSCRRSSMYHGGKTPPQSPHDQEILQVDRHPVAGRYS
jgi:uncharacterized protein (DUF302 family)